MGVRDAMMKDVRLEEFARSNYEEWEFSANLTREKTYILEIEYNEEWGKAFTQMGTEAPQPVNVTIISPSGGETKLQAFFSGVLSTNLYVPVTALEIVNVTYCKVDSDDLQVDEPSWRIRFTVKQEGNYTARVIKEELKWTEGPPNALMFYEEVPRNTGLYMLLLQVGGPMFFVGAIFSIWGLTITKKSKVKRKNFSREKQVVKIRSDIV
jgi:hypothetical protein